MLRKREINFKGSTNQNYESTIHKFKQEFRVRIAIIGGVGRILVRGGGRREHIATKRLQRGIAGHMGAEPPDAGDVFESFHWKSI